MPYKDPEKAKEHSRRYIRKHYRNNKEYYKSKASKRREKIRDWISKYKEDRGCQECGENHPACLDLHHRDPTKKDVNPAQIGNKGWGMKRVEAEVAKCDVLCSNCHRKLHYEEKTCA